MKTAKPWMLILMVSLLVLTGCSNQVAQSKKYFRIKTIEFNEAAEKRNLTLVVKRPKALSILGGRPMVATRDDDSLVQLSHHFWLESPKVLLQDIFNQWASGHWHKVSFQEPANEAYQVLESRILAFEKQQQSARLSIEFQLYDQDRLLLFSRQLSHNQVIDGEGYRAFARAIGQALEQVLKELAHEL